MRKRSSLLLALSVTSVAAGALLACGAPQRPDGGEGLLEVGAAAPELTGPDQHGALQSIADERGHALVVYFYPKDGTPGCTKEACAFRDVWDRYEAAGVQIFGVSGDDTASHESFSKEQNIPFPLVADPEHEWTRAFGVSTTLGMASRVSFLVGADGKIAKVYPDVDPGVHATTVLADATALNK